VIRKEKRGHIPNELPLILVWLQINPRIWLRHMRPQGNRFGRAIGRVEALRAHARECGKRWIEELALSGALFGRAGVIGCCSLDGRRPQTNRWERKTWKRE
jgi:hypothetical protein